MKSDTGNKMSDQLHLMANQWAVWLVFTGALPPRSNQSQVTSHQLPYCWPIRLRSRRDLIGSPDSDWLAVPYPSSYEELLHLTGSKVGCLISHWEKGWKARRRRKRSYLSSVSHYEYIDWLEWQATRSQPKQHRRLKVLSSPNRVTRLFVCHETGEALM